ncbi:PREDICTED: uncharacterized protein LOC106109067 isoform X2 [Papilio polytes]|uniref:uncharacterized protein LOC106109067 isoform X1 n=1 Tax=Papilio polytes TaxID=76194 RepID=UPI00067676C0|nr:PREDICTED: uncharacterized protein LOC106109067 isoform X1 [Papilio polytes]XP_013145918.1 PREDICTED: uncharacterized protein LOC106109067 isoform X2 [Papilio polytes]
MSDILSYDAEPPQLVIGLDNWELIITREFKKGEPGQPVASNTKLGWVLHGVDIGSAEPIHYLSACVQEDMVYKTAANEGNRKSVARTPTPTQTSRNKKRRSKRNSAERKSACFDLRDNKREVIAPGREQPSLTRKAYSWPKLNVMTGRTPDVIRPKYNLWRQKSNMEKCWRPSKRRYEQDNQKT